MLPLGLKQMDAMEFSGLLIEDMIHGVFSEIADDIVIYLTNKQKMRQFNKNLVCIKTVKYCFLLCTYLFYSLLIK